MIAISKRLALRAWVSLLWITGQLFEAKQRLRRSKGVLVLMLHRVLNDESAKRTYSQSEIIVLQRTFESMMRYVLSEFEIIDLRQSTTIPDTQGTRPRLAITFDDGWKDNYTGVFSLTSNAEFKFSVFICPQLVGKCFPFWPEKVAAGLKAQKPKVSSEAVSATVERLKIMASSEREQYIASLTTPSAGETDATFGWAEALEMKRCGINFGSHTSTHQMLTRILPGEARREILDSRTEIRSHLGEPVDLFAYPNGDVSAKVREMVAEAGYRMAFTTRPGVWTLLTDPLAIPRVNVSEAKVTGLSGRFSRLMFDYSMIWKVARTL